MAIDVFYVMCPKGIPSQRSDGQAAKYSQPDAHVYGWDRWRLEIADGAQRWTHLPSVSDSDSVVDRNEGLEAAPDRSDRDFIFDRSKNPNSADRVYRRQARRGAPSSSLNDADHAPDNTPDHALERAMERAMERGIAFYGSLQSDEGFWPGDYGGPMFLLPGLLIAAHVTGTELPAPHRALMRRYMLNHQLPDGGWGLHVEGESTLFGTVMQYVALRILGMEAGHEALARARAWIHAHGGATGLPPWGKFFLSVLGVYAWKGNNSLFPEMWLLPRSAPIHPSRYWCHARMVYLPMAYCYGYRLTAPASALTGPLREELYPEGYENVDWERARRHIDDADLYASPSPLFRRLSAVLNRYERRPIMALRRKALRFIAAYVDAEDDQTDFVDIGPVNQIINSLVVWHAHGAGSDRFKRHVDRWYEYLWVAEDGMKMNGYNGSQLWDTALAAQALLEGDPTPEARRIATKAYAFIERSQIRQEPPQRQRYFRHRSVGGWPFSTRAHGWPISDCTAEGLSAVLLAHRTAAEADIRVSFARQRQAAELLLSWQNADGGWATYELTRGQSWLEALNPSGVFDRIMIDYSYTECTSACLRALCAFNECYPGVLSSEIGAAIRKGAAFILSQQRENGSWEGSWGVCFTYGTWFGVEGLVAALRGGHLDNTMAVHRAIRVAVGFLLEKQRPDGAWGESYRSCTERRYIEHERAQVVNSSWALLGLMAAERILGTAVEHTLGTAGQEAGNPGDSTLRMAVDSGIRFILRRQTEDGDWPQEAISGVFNRSCMITYTAYRNIFPLWALGRYEDQFALPDRDRTEAKRENYADVSAP